MQSVLNKDVRNRRAGREKREQEREKGGLSDSPQKKSKQNNSTTVKGYSSKAHAFLCGSD